LSKSVRNALELSSHPHTNALFATRNKQASVNPVSSRHGGTRKRSSRCWHAGL